MEIQKIFSEIDTDERIYSVLMNEDEYKLYSENDPFQKYKIKRFSFFGMDIFDFFDLIKDIKFQNKSTDLIDNSKSFGEGLEPKLELLLRTFSISGSKLFFNIDFIFLD